MNPNLPQCATVGPSEWIKTIVSLLVGAMLGLLSALFIEPLKVKRMRKLEARLGQAQLYEELGRLLTAFRVAVLQPEIYCMPLVRRIKFERFDYYFNQRREIFYAMADCNGIRSLHGQFALILSPEQVEKHGAKNSVQELINAYEYAMKVGELDRKEVEAAAQRQDAESRKKGPILYEHIVRTNQGD